MLLARGHKRIGGADLKWAMIFAPRAWAVVVRRSGLVLDTRFVPPISDESPTRACVYLLLRGAWTVHANGESPPRRVDAPAAFVVTEEHMEGSNGARSRTFSARGKPYETVEIHVERDDLTVAPGPDLVPLRLGATVWSAATDVLRASEDDATLSRAFGALVAELEGPALRAGCAVRLRAPTAKPFAILWGALRPMIERLYLNPTLQEVEAASGVSTRQLDRYIQRFVTSSGLVGTRWRSSTRHIRLKLAIILLSAEDASVSDVASAVGYGSPDALARLFRDAGLAAPAVIQREVRRARDEG